VTNVKQSRKIKTRKAKIQHKRQAGVATSLQAAGRAVVFRIFKQARRQVLLQCRTERTTDINC